MLLNLIRDLMDGGTFATQTYLLQFFVLMLIIFACFPIHEFAHAWTAKLLGDDVPERQGRVSLNPFAHLDLMGSVCLFAFGFGWAKPVMTNPVNYRKVKMRTGMALVALAGPISNILLALIGMIVMKLIPIASFEMGVPLIAALSYFIEVNLFLAVFNLIPIPPLDGSKVLLVILKERAYFKFMQYEQYFFPVLLILMATGVLGGIVSFITNYLWLGLHYLTFFIG